MFSLHTTCLGLFLNNTRKLALVRLLTLDGSESEEEEEDAESEEDWAGSRTRKKGKFLSFHQVLY